MPTDTFDWAVLVAAVIAALASLYSIHITRKTTFINTITSERIRWMEALRNKVSKMCSIVYRLSANPSDQKRQEKLTEIDRLMGLIRLLVNPREHVHILVLLQKISYYFDAEKENEAINSINRILGDTTREEALKRNLNDLIDSTQTLLKDEWERVKKEAREGELAEDKVINRWLHSDVRRALYGRNKT